MAMWTPNDEASLLGWWDSTDSNSYSTITKVWTKRWGTLANLTGAGDGPSKTAVGFDGTKSALVFQGSLDTGLSIATPWYHEFVLVLVYRFTTTPSASVNMSDRADGTGGRYTPFDFGGAQVNYGSQSQNYFDGGAHPVTTISVSRHARNSRILRWNGEEEINDTTAAAADGNTATAHWLFKYTAGTPTYSCQVAAFGIFASSGWSTDLAEKIEGYIAHANGGIGATTVQLPSGHPYKTVAPEGPAVDLEVSVAQTVANFSQSAVVGPICTIAVAQTIADFGQSAVISPFQVLTVTQTIADFGQSFTGTTTAIAGNIAVEQTIDNFLQLAVLFKITSANTNEFEIRPSCGPGQYGTVVSARPPSGAFNGGRRWPTK